METSQEKNTTQQESFVYASERSGQQTPPQNYTINNIIALIFVVMVLIDWYFPLQPICEKLGDCSGFSMIVSFSMWIFGPIAGGSFLIRILRLTRDLHPAVRILSFFVGVAGGIFIGIVGLISGIIGAWHASPPVGSS